MLEEYDFSKGMFNPYVKHCNKKYDKNILNATTIEAMEEADKISRDPNTKCYLSFSEIMSEIMAEVNTNV